MIASGGAKQALMVLLHAILDPKEEVIFPGALLGELSGDGENRWRRSRAGDGAKMEASSRLSRRS